MKGYRMIITRHAWIYAFVFAAAYGVVKYAVMPHVGL